MKGTVTLNEAQKLKKQIYAKCIAKNMKTLQAAIMLGVTQRTVQLNINRYKALGDKIFIHGNTGKIHHDENIEQRKKIVTDIFLNTRIDGENPFENVTYALFTRLLHEIYNIACSKGWVRKLLRAIGYTSPKLRKPAKICEHLYRERKKYAGELVQADGTSYDWFGNGHKYCIQSFLDDATGVPVGMYMTKNECLLGYDQALINMAEDFGLPIAIYPDRLSVFFDNSKKNKKRPIAEKNLTQFGAIVKQLGIDMFPAYSPQAKGRIERSNLTHKDQLPVLFKLYGIKDPESANKFLREKYIPYYKKYFGVKPAEKESCFVKADMKTVKKCIRAVFPGKTDKSGVFSLKGYRFFCHDLPHTKIHICLSETDGIWVERQNDPKRKRYEVILCETDTTGRLPEVYKLLIEKVFLKNAKPRFREVYYEMNEEYIA